MKRSIKTRVVTNQTDDSTGSGDYTGRWSAAMRKLEFEAALSVLDEALQAATEARNTQDITFYTNLREYTRKIWNAYLTKGSM
jgi:hypothetical protein